MTAPTVDLLDMIPRRLAGHVPGEGDLVVVIAPRFKSDFWKRHAPKLGIKPFVHLRLDRIGSAAWLAMDGTATLREVGGRIEADLGPMPDLGERLARFALDLRRNDLLELCGQPEAGPENSPEV